MSFGNVWSGLMSQILIKARLTSTQHDRVGVAPRPHSRIAVQDLIASGDPRI